jgi:hypothetical protein
MGRPIVDCFLVVARAFDACSNRMMFYLLKSSPTPELKRDGADNESKLALWLHESESGATPSLRDMKTNGRIELWTLPLKNDS